MADKRNLYFEHKDGSLTLVAETIAEEEVYQRIKAYIMTLNPNYKIYYIRNWFNEDETVMTYDVGSYTEFFYWGEVKKDA